MSQSVLARSRRRLSPEVVVGVVFVSSLFMTVMDVTVVNVAIPTISREFHAPISSVQWVATGYLLSLAMWIPASGWIGDRFGTKRVLLGAIAIFILGSAWCAAAHNMTELTAARVFQGVGGGMMQPVGMALLFRTFPPERQGESIPDLDHPDGSGTRPRPDRRRFPRAARVMALGVSHQHSDRSARR